MIFVGLGLSAYVRLDIAMLACIGYLLMTILTYINTIVGGEFKISYGKVGPTELRIIAVIVNIIIFFCGNPLLRLPFIVSSIKDAARWSIIDPGV